MKVVIAADHGGFELKGRMARVLQESGHEVLDLGTHSADPVDYPDYTRALGQAILDGRAERGVMICGSGAGAAIAVNKMRGILAALAHDTYTAHQMVEHDNVSVCCLGALVVGAELAAEIVTTFLGARFTGEERHVRRVNKIMEIEREGR